jgi:hypothetical protein
LTTPKIIVLDLPHDRRWLWYKDLQILALDTSLNAADSEAAVDEFLSESRRSLVTQLDRPAV